MAEAIRHGMDKSIEESFIQYLDRWFGGDNPAMESFQSFVMDRVESNMLLPGLRTWRMFNKM